MNVGSVSRAISYHDLRYDGPTPLYGNEPSATADHIYTLEHGGVDASKNELKEHLEALSSGLRSSDAVESAKKLQLLLKNHLRITDAYATVTGKSPAARAKAEKRLLQNLDEVVPLFQHARESVEGHIDDEKRASQGPKPSQRLGALQALHSKLSASEDRLARDYEDWINAQKRPPHPNPTFVVTEPPFREVSSPSSSSKLLWIGGGATLTVFALLAWAVAAQQAQRQTPTRRIIIQNPPPPYRPPLPPPPPSQVIVVMPSPKNDSGNSNSNKA